MNTIKQLFALESKPRRGLLSLDWAVLAYMGFTLLLTLFFSTRLENPDAMLWGRLRIGAMTVALWAAYRLVPCRLTLCVRVVAQMAQLAWWYPDTYEFNRLLPNLDHVFATMEQSLFGCQPALYFASALPSPVVSELMSLGYAFYYPMIAVVCFFYFFRRYEEFERCSFIVLASFFLCYVVYLFLPVTGPTFYYKAIGLTNAAHGVFPHMGDYFATHTDCLPTPGYADGFFYHLVEDAKAAGERPTAAFPSSHVAVATVCMLLAGHSRSRRLVLVLAPLYVLLCLSTVYIQAHYVVDAIAGLFTGLLLYFVLLFATRRMKASKKK